MTPASQVVLKELPPKLDKLRFSNPSIILAGSFLDLPLELRIPIYFLVIRPDCMKGCKEHHEHHRGSQTCVNFMVTCSQIYVETIDILQSAKQTFMINAAGMQVFKHGKDFPHLDRFRCETRISRCYIPPSVSELEFIRFREVTLTLDFLPLKEGRASDVEHYKRVARNSSTVARTISKMTNCVTVRICLRPPPAFDFYVAKKKKLVKMEEALSVLLKVLVAKKISLIMVNYKESDWTGFGLDLVKIAMSLKLEVISAPVPSETPIQTIDTTTDLDRNDDWGAAEPPLKAISNICVEEFKDWRPTTELYQIVPECRKCFETFASLEELQAHLTRFRNHRMDFKLRQVNEVQEIRPRENRGRVCWTCARGFLPLDKLNDHLDKMHHRRHGIIPRYLEDNDEYDRSWAAWFEEKGWL